MLTSPCYLRISSLNIKDSLNVKRNQKSFGNTLQNQPFKKNGIYIYFSTGSEAYCDMGFKDLLKERQHLQP